MPAFRHLSVWKVGDLSVVQFKAHSLHGSSIMEVGEELSAVAAEDGCRSLVLNLSNVDFLFSDTLGRIVTAHKIMKQKGGRLSLCEVRPPIGEVLSVTKLDTILNIIPDIEGEGYEASEARAWETGTVSLTCDR
jgi:anti-anti-sigma factor